MPHSTAILQSKLCRPAVLQPTHHAAHHGVCRLGSRRARKAFRPFAAPNTQASRPQSPDYSKLSQVFTEMNQAPPSVVSSSLAHHSCNSEHLLQFAIAAATTCAEVQQVCTAKLKYLTQSSLPCYSCMHCNRPMANTDLRL